METQPWYAAPVPFWHVALLIALVFAIHWLTNKVLRKVVASTLVGQEDSVEVTRRVELMLEDLIRIEPERSDIYDLARVEMVRYRERMEPRIRVMRAVSKNASPIALVRLAREVQRIDQRHKRQRDQEPPPYWRTRGLDDDPDDD